MNPVIDYTLANLWLFDVAIVSLLKISQLIPSYSQHSHIYWLSKLPLVTLTPIIMY